MSHAHPGYLFSNPARLLENQQSTEATTWRQQQPLLTSAGKTVVLLVAHEVNVWQVRSCTVCKVDAWDGEMYGQRMLARSLATG